jgi:hypothetical protein
MLDRSGFDGGVVQMIISRMTWVMSMVASSPRPKNYKWDPITSQDDQIIQLHVIKFHPALDEILYYGLPSSGRKPNCKGSVWMGHLPVKAGSVIFRFESRLERGLSFCIQFLRRAIATVSSPFF